MHALTAWFNRRNWVATVAMVGLVTATVDAATVRTYMVGNSLTWDSQPEGVKGLAQQRGNTFDVGYHIRCGSSLPNILANPADTCIVPAAPYGTFQGGLSGFQWDSVTLQPFNAGSTLATDTAAALSLINTTRQNPANTSTRFYLYAGWPQLPVYPGAPVGAYASEWAAPIANADNTPIQMSRQYFSHLLSRVRAGTDAEV